VIAVFAISAVACISILTASFTYAGDTKATAHALIAAESGAEVFKATGGDYDKVADVLGGVVISGDAGTVIVEAFYDRAWQVSNEANADFKLNLVGDAPGNSHAVNLITGELTVSRITGEPLVVFPLAARVS